MLKLNLNLNLLRYNVALPPKSILSANLLSIMISHAKNSNVSTKHSAMIIKGNNKIVASGYNNNRTCMSGHQTCTQHAEASAIINLLIQNGARQSLKMLANGKWIFLWDKAVAKSDKEVQISGYPV
jgi:hypothetical protein